MIIIKQKCIRLLNDIQNDNVAMGDLVNNNFDFNKNVILSECFRLNDARLIDLFLSKKSDCTLEMSKQFNDDNRFMKLNDLEYYLFKDFNKNNSAIDKAESCLRCYCKIIFEYN